MQYIAADKKNTYYKIDSEFNNKSDIALVNQVIELVGGIKEFAKLIKVSERTIYAWKKGSRHPKRVNMLLIEDLLKGFSSDLVRIKQKKVLYAGHEKSSCLDNSSNQLTGFDNTLTQDLRSIQFYNSSKYTDVSMNIRECPFNIKWIQTQQNINLEALCLFSVFGRSMYPIFSPGDVCVINREHIELIDDKVYLLKVKDSLYLRRFFQTPKSLLFRSDCRDYDYQDINLKIHTKKQEWEIVGRVVWVIKKI